MKRIISFILFYTSFLLEISSSIGIYYNDIIIQLHSGIYEDDTKNNNHRSLHYAMIKENVLTFDFFEADCSLQIIDVDNETVIFEDFVFSGDTQCAIPIIPTGNYMIKFESYEFVYSGYFQI